MRISRKLGLYTSSGGISAIPEYTGEYELLGDVSSGSMKLYTSGILTFSGKASISVFAVGGGASGVRGMLVSNVDDTSTGSGGQGGQGGYTARGSFSVTGDVAVTIGAGGAICSSHYKHNAGGDTIFGSYLTALGGTTDGGGSGGGGGAVGYGPYVRNGFVGGSDGDDGEEGGVGQGTTTRAFGETDGELYAGGGGGGGVRHSSSDDLTEPGAGGEGGGGTGGTYNSDGASGLDNTGGGGGGGGCDYANKKYYKGGAGGSGIVIIRW